MDMETNLPEEETSILTLTDENGQDLDFEYLDCIAYQDKEYLVLMPEGEDEIVIMEIEPVDEENENYLAVEDEAVLDAVYGIFKEKFKDILTFEDEAAGPPANACPGGSVFVTPLGTPGIVLLHRRDGHIL